MNCDVCKQDNASIFLTQVVEGKVQKVNLCANCAKESGVTDPTGFNLAELLKGMGEQTIQTKSSRGVICPNCGFSQGDFKKTGRMGCSECYEVFAENLGGLLKAMHKGMQHVGKTPTSFEPSEDGETVGENRIEALQRELESSIAEENYEQAARIRDEMRQIETEPVPTESEL